jgi:hypothetical protein
VTAYGQTGSEVVRTDFGIAIGMSPYQLKDNVLNKVRHAGSGFSLALSHERIRESSRSRFELSLGFNQIGSRYESERETVALATLLNYRRVRAARQFSPHLNLFLGGIAGVDSRIGFFENWDESHIYWLTSYYLGPTGVLTYSRSGASTLSLEVSLPLLALVSRPPERSLYKELDPSFSGILSYLHEDLRLTSIHQHRALDVTVRYSFGQTASLGKTLFWRLTYIHNSMPHSRDIDILSHTFGVAVLF